jgi:hypothetical protein
MLRHEWLSPFSRAEASAANGFCDEVVLVCMSDGQSDSVRLTNRNTKGRNESKTIMERHSQRIALDEPAVYQIQVQGVISQHWLGYFDEMKISVEGEDGTAITTLSGQIVDQAALQGMLQKIYTLGLVLLKIERKL